MRTISVLFISFLVMVMLPFLIHINAYPHGENYFAPYHYTLQHGYKSSVELFKVLAQKSTSLNNVFLWCCDCILYYARLLHLTYEELNIYLFIIWQPYLIALFAYLFIGQYRRNTKTQKEYLLSTPSRFHVA
jgi:hypothetical protein